LKKSAFHLRKGSYGKGLALEGEVFVIDYSGATAPEFHRLPHP